MKRIILLLSLVLLVGCKPIIEDCITSEGSFREMEYNKWVSNNSILKEPLSEKYFNEFWESEQTQHNFRVMVDMGVCDEVIYK